eukprot:5917912-Pyramimonas_sp.AAC.1
MQGPRGVASEDGRGWAEGEGFKGNLGQLLTLNICGLVVRALNKPSKRGRRGGKACCINVNCPCLPPR